MKTACFLILMISLSSHAGSLPFVKYPFHPARGILCDQGNQSPTGNSHTFGNTLYALDLATPKGADPAGIYASTDGVIIAYDKCVEFNTECGAGFGNHIKLLAADGTLVLYAHLERTMVKTGDYVQAGQFIAVEGNTGMTGEDNRHLHFSVHQDWRSNGFDYYKKYLGSLPDSVPFRMNVCQTRYGTCEGIPLDVRKLKCKRVTGLSEWLTNF